MVSGSVGLDHPALNPSSAFRKAATPLENTHRTLLLIDPADSDPSQAIQDVCELNRDSASAIRERNESFVALQSEGKRDQAWEVFDGCTEGLKSRWESLATKYGDNLKFVSSLASALSSHLGPTLMTACEDLGDGLCRIELSKQTTFEHIGGGELAGENNRSYLSLKGSVSVGEVTTETPVFGDKRATVLVEPARGMALVDRNMRTTELGLQILA